MKSPLLTHDRGTVAVFISCEHRQVLDAIRKAIEKKTGYPVSLKAVLGKAIEQMAKQ